jgi:hypothetical protein
MSSGRRFHPPCAIAPYRVMVYSFTRLNAVLQMKVRDLVTGHVLDVNPAHVMRGPQMRREDRQDARADIRRRTRAAPSPKLPTL